MSSRIASLTSLTTNYLENDTTPTIHFTCKTVHNERMNATEICREKKSSTKTKPDITSPPSLSGHKLFCLQPISNSEVFHLYVCTMCMWPWMLPEEKYCVRISANLYVSFACALTTIITKLGWNRRRRKKNQNEFLNEFMCSYNSELASRTEIGLKRRNRQEKKLVFNVIVVCLGFV